MKNFSDLLDTDLWLTVCVNQQTHTVGLHSPLVFNAEDNVTVDGIEVLPKYQHLAVDNKLTIAMPFYQWYHHASGQGWLLEPQ